MRFGTKRFNPVFTNMLMDGVVFSSGGFGAGYGGNGDESDLEEEDFGGGGEDSNNDEITLDDGADVLDTLFKPEEGKEDESEETDEDPTFPTQDEVTAELKAVLEGYDVPDDLIPEDLDMTDRKSVREFATNIGRHAVQSALAAMFKPIQIAMSQQEHGLRKAIKESVRGETSRTAEESILLEVIPAAANKADRAVINTLFAQAKLKHPKDPRKAATVTRDSMKALGMNPNGRKSAGVKTGNSGLDLYTGKLPVLDKPTSRNADRLRRTPPK